MNTLADSNPSGEWYCPSCEKQYGTGGRCPEDGTKLVKLSVRVDPHIGRELDGRYTILEKLGQGGMGAVYRGSQHSVGREVAIKVISPSLISEPDVIKRFLREAKLASKLAHPNAVAVLDFGQTDDGVFYLVMELVSGRTLDAVFKSEHTFRPERVVRIGTQVCDALEGAHALHIVHRDLKPSNIMVLHRGRDLVKVLDFGLAKSVASDHTSTTMTNTGALLGTPAFIPPELALGLPCDGRADLYSLGCVLYQLGSGRLPFLSSSTHELIALHATERVPAMTGVPAALGRVIDRLLEKDPTRRYQSATEARDALEAALEGRVATPAGSVLVRSSDTTPSIGPFPQTTEDLIRSDTLSPATRKVGPADVAQLVNSATLPAASAAPVSVTAQVARPRKRWLVPAIAAAVIALGGGALVMTRGGSSQSPAVPARPAASEPAPPAPGKPAAPVVAPPAATATPVESASPPAEPATRPADVAKKPVKPAHATKPSKPATPKLASEPAKPPVETPPPPAGSNKSTLPF
jgi:serine/threonine-protein kinase